MHASPPYASPYQTFVLERMQDLRPSLTINLYANGFSLEPQAVAHPYSPTMKILLACIDKQVWDTRRAQRGAGLLGGRTCSAMCRGHRDGGWVCAVHR